MKIERVRWKDWEAVRCVAPACEMVVGVSAGPRILSLRRGTGPNLLYHDTTDFRVGDWRLYGGHRVDEGCNLEVFSCADYVELETLSGRVTLAPGGQATHRQYWRLLAPTFTPQDWLAIGVQAGFVSTARAVQYGS